MIRDGAPDDVLPVANLLTLWAASTPWLPRVHTRFEEIGFAKMLIAQGLTRVAYHEQRVLGFIARDGNEVHGLYLAPFAQNRGIGRDLLADAKCQTPSLGLFVFQQNTDAQRFYKRHNFAEISRSDGRNNDEKLPEIRYEWSA